MNRIFSSWQLGLLLLVPSALLAQLRVDWFTVDGGGGTSSGGNYSLSGSVGQPDAGVAMTNAQFSLTGGFWALPVAQQFPGLPILTIAPATPGYARVSWSPITTNFVLQQASSLPPTKWVNAPTGMTNPIIVPATLPTKFYRLVKQQPS